MSSGSQGFGDAIKGAANTVHGLGEVIRGTINDGADKLGEGIATDGKTTGTDAKRQNDLALDGHAPQDHAATVQDGKDQIGQGLNSVQNAKNAENRHGA